MNQDFFKGKTVVVTGGTGSFGHQITKMLIPLGPKRVVIFSRDEKKQDDMRKEMEEYGGVLDFGIGDIRDYHRLREVMKGADIVYQAAALKQIPSCEETPLEAVKTNILGAENVARAACEAGAEVVVTVSTDKAVKPTNVMGMTKALQERVYMSLARQGKHPTRFLCVRYGNVIGTRGSVIPFFRDRIRQGKPLPVTSSKMTRFLLRLPEAIKLVFRATVEGKSGELWVRKMPSCYIGDLASVMAKGLTGRDDYPIREVGVRPGEKIHEVLVSEEEMRRAEERDEYFVIYPYKGLEGYAKLEGYYHDGDMREYASDNTRIMGKEELERLLREEGWIDGGEPEVL